MGGRAGGSGTGMGSRSSYKGPDGIMRYNLPKGYTDVHQVAKALRLYTPMDRWNRNTAYSLGFNDTAHQLVETIAKGDFGLASTISKQAVGSKWWGKYGAKLSDKQSYVLAHAAINNKLVWKDTIFEK